MKFLQPLAMTPDRFQSLGSDLSSMYSGKSPDRDALSTAPLVSNWEVSGFFAAALEFDLENETEKRNEQSIYDYVWVIDTENSWVRTTCGLYRLGERKPPRKRRVGYILEEFLRQSDNIE